MPFTLRIAPSASQDRLEQLIAARVEPGADRAAIDRKIWNMFGECWAVMFTDLAGFSRRVEEFGIIHFLQTVFESHRLLVPCIEDHCGILLKLEGDSMMVIFRSADEALKCGIAMQATTNAYNQTRAPEEQVLLCMGIGYGPVLRIGDADVFGAEVNAASKLGEEVAGAGEILVTAAIRDQLTAASCYRYTQVAADLAGEVAAFRVNTT